MEPEENEVKIEGEEEEKKLEERKLEGKEFLAHELHKEVKLSTLRSYQGDMAEFIRDKNESVLSIAAKEKKKKDELRKQAQELRNKEPKEEKPTKKSGDSIQVNLTILVTSALLILGGVTAGIYIFDYLNKIPEGAVQTSNQLLPFGGSINIANATKESVKLEFEKLVLQNGLNEIKITDNGGNQIENARNFLSFMQISPPATLARTLREDFALGAYPQEGKVAKFLILRINDFGLAFASMLEWEKTMAVDLDFLIARGATASTTPVANFTYWKDLIIQNKDVRAIFDDKGVSQIGYVFLDKNTILIIDNINAIKDLVNAFASRPFAQ